MPDSVSQREMLPDNLPDATKAEAVYEGMTPLRGSDIADCIAWAATRPSHVNIDEIVVRPRDQAAATLVHRKGRD